MISFVPFVFFAAENYAYIFPTTSPNTSVNR